MSAPWIHTGDADVRDLTDKEIQFLRAALVGEIVPGAESLLIDPKMIHRLLDEVEFLRANVRDYFTGKDDVYTSASVALAQHVRALANTERTADAATLGDVESGLLTEKPT